MTAVTEMEQIYNKIQQNALMAAPTTGLNMKTSAATSTWKYGK